MVEDRQDELIARTIAAWQPRSSLQISSEDARQIVENAVGFFRILLEWDKAQRVGKSSAIAPTPPTPTDRGGGS